MLSTLPLAARPLIRARGRTTTLMASRLRIQFSSSPSSTTPSNSSGTGQQPVNPRERAKQLHHEIEDIVKNQGQKHEKELNKAKSFAGFVEFLGKHKTNISVIVVSFLTVVLSIKLVQYKQQYKELEKQLINTEGKVDQKRNLLRAITEETFIHEMATKCEKQLNNNNGGSRLWGLGGKKDTTTTVISSVLENELVNLIGDEALTEDERTAKVFRELQKSNNSSTDMDRLSTLAQQSSHNSPGGDGEQMEFVEDASGRKVVKKSVFRI